MADYDYRRFEDIPSGTAFADKFGRIGTKHSAGHATDHGYFNDDGIFQWEFDESREYLDADDDELDDCDTFDAYPYYALPNVKPLSPT
ncbi:hypothetical protein DQP57_00235 [Mycobacterium colombiense]|uniref:Uncharacterized protein n=1 Tax=Mycobacterium colombiense TaxID=339268 RepID=A0A329MCD3_9MYCO|nr:hypothetical protein [Mycobacterium colombiense]RAV17490.1 hypothetical protein DQP57_00235 [Mycobacterium colombiense]